MQKLILLVSLAFCPLGAHGASAIASAYGDFKIDTSGCSMTASSTTLTCQKAAFAAGDVGKSMYVSKAGNSQATLTTTITAYVSPTSVTLGQRASGPVAKTPIAWGHDDTKALEDSYRKAIHDGTSFYIPSGNYLHHGLNWTGNNIKIDGDSFGGTILWAFDVTNPGKVTSDAQTTGVDLSGSGYNEVDHIAFMGAWSGFADMAPKVNVLGARTGSAGNAVAIAHIFDGDFFLTQGEYDVLLYGYEQTDFRNCHFEASGPSNSGALYLSAANTPGVKSPYTKVVPPINSMTKVSANGARTVFAGNGKLVVLDQGHSLSNYSIAIRDAYVNLNGGGVFLSDTGPGALRNVVLDAVYIETGTCTNCRAVLLKGAAWNWRLENVQFYTAGPGISTAPYYFTNGFLDSEAMIDSTGQSSANGCSEFMASSCAGSTLHLGQQMPTTNCLDYAYASSVQGVFPQSPVAMAVSAGASAQERSKATQCVPGK